MTEIIFIFVKESCQSSYNLVSHIINKSIKGWLSYLGFFFSRLKELVYMITHFNSIDSSL